MIINLYTNHLMSVNMLIPQIIEVVVKTPDTKCSMCSRKLKWTDVKCRCGIKFCRKHRLPFDHECTADHKAIEKERIRKNNQKVETNKMLKI
jgi:predicted nucleic acid binding AN1-type Zn finger protein